MADVHSSLMDDAEIRMRDGKITPSSEIHHLTSSPSQDGDNDDRIRTARDIMMKVEQPELILDMEVAAVEVVTASKQPRRGRGRPKINKDTENTVDTKPRVKRPYKKRGSKATADPVPKAKRKYVRKQKGATNDKSGVEKIKDKDKEKEKKEKKEKEKEKEKKEKEKKEKVKKVNEKKERRKKVTEEKKPRQKKPRKTPAKKVKQLIQPLTPAMINARQKFNDDALSDNSEDSVVFCQEFRPPDVNNHSRRLAFVPDRDLYPDGIRPENNLLQGKLPKTKSKPPGRESPIVSRLEDSSSGNSNSSSNSDTSDSDSSDTTDDDGDNQSERRTMDAEDRLSGDGAVYNGISSRLSASPDRLQSSSDTDSASSSARNDDGKRNGIYRSGTPPRSPSSASSENADKSFQCHTCRKWFSSTVTLRIHKRSHVSRSGNGSSGALSSGGGQRSSRRYECDCCDATFTRRERLEQHRSQVHKGALTERCEVCGRGFEDEEQQRRHTALHTPDERSGRCGECGEVVNGWEELRRHRAAHAPTAAHACPLCRKAFTYPHSLSRHLLNHSKAVYKCVVCKTSFSDADSLAKHLNSHLDRYKQLKT